ncbi:MAG: hypothetical protein WDM77_14900 [Steroidobacteraceae bacterium]
MGTAEAVFHSPSPIFVALDVLDESGIRRKCDPRRIMRHQRGQVIIDQAFVTGSGLAGYEGLRLAPGGTDRDGGDHHHHQPILLVHQHSSNFTSNHGTPAAAKPAAAQDAPA